MAQEAGSKEPERRGLTVTERFFARMALAQTITALVAVIISCAALYATWEQARAARIQTEAQVWPRIVSFMTRNVSQDGAEVFEMVVANPGVGPADVRSVRMRVDGETVTSFADLFAMLPPAASPANVTHGYLNGRLLSPGEEAMLIRVEGGERIDAMLALIGRMEVELCYCSILDQCWLIEGQIYSDTPTCPDRSAEEFRN